MRASDESAARLRRRRLLKQAVLGTGALGLGGSILGSASLAATPAPEALAEGTESTPGAEDERPFWFGFIGDTPYSGLEEGALQRVFDAMASQPLEFVLHVGDIKSSREICSDELLRSRLALLDACPHPLILTPGDNEWTDCGRRLPPWAAGGRLERLDWLRANAFGRPQSLGARRMAVEQQGRYVPAGAHGGAPPGPAELETPRLPENLRWRIGSLQFCTLHVVGGNNALRRVPEPDEAWLLRQQANGEWLNDTVRKALREKARGLVIGLHANMRFEDQRSDGWERMRQLVIAAAVAFDGPVLLLHGDTHRFRTDRLLQRSHGLANFLRVECFGSPFSSSWVQIRWDPGRARAGSATESDPFQVSIQALP